MAEVFKNPAQQANDMAKKSLRERWNKYFKYGMRGTNVDKWNKELEDIENELQFNDDEEHDKWLQMSDIWKGESEWPDMTSEIISRGEDGYKGSDRAAELADAYFKRQIGGYKPIARTINFSPQQFDEIINASPYKDSIDWDRHMDHISNILGIKPSQHVSQLYRKGKKVYGVEGQDEGEPIERLLYELGGK